MQRLRQRPSRLTASSGETSSTQAGTARACVPSSTADPRAERESRRADRSWRLAGPTRTRTSTCFYDARRCGRGWIKLRACTSSRPTGLRLEPLDESRLEEFVSLACDPEVMRWWAPGGAFTREEADSNFAASLAQLHELGFGRRWIVLTETGAGIGFTETKPWRDEVELGWMLTPSAWGHGYATEAGRAIRDDAFERLALESVIAVHHRSNAASRRIIEKLGLTFERELGTSEWPLPMYRLTREDWAVAARSRTGTPAG